jgi:hypothetical protein
MSKCPSGISKRPNTATPSAAVLSKTAATMIPFYCKIACDARYAREWSKAVASADLGKLIRLFRRATRIRNPMLSTNSIGYFLDLSFPPPLYLYTNGTSQRAGTAQFRFSAKAHRHIAAAILPLYLTIRDSKPFAGALANAIRLRKRKIIEQLVRSRVRSPYLRHVELIHAGFAMGYRVPGVKGTYYNDFFREIMG